MDGYQIPQSDLQMDRLWMDGYETRQNDLLAPQLSDFTMSKPKAKPKPTYLDQIAPRIITILIFDIENTSICRPRGGDHVGGLGTESVTQTMPDHHAGTHGKLSHIEVFFGGGANADHLRRNERDGHWDRRIEDIEIEGQKDR